MRKFPLTVLCGDEEDGVVCRPVQVGTPFAPTQLLHFQAQQPLSFLSICTLHWCKHCTELDVPPNVHKSPFTALCGDAEDGVVCRPVQVGALFAPTKGLHFQALQPLSFHCICTLHWGKHCTGLEVPPNMRKYAFTVLCGDAKDGVVFRPVHVGALFAPPQGLHFQALLSRSFLSIFTLHWYKRCTGE